MSRSNLRSGPFASPSRFSARPLNDLLGDHIPGVFDDDSWDLGDHPHFAGGQGQRFIHFDAFPKAFRDSAKEMLILATDPEPHSADWPALLGAKPKDVKTVVRWMGDLAIDLTWLLGRSSQQTLRSVTQDDLDALTTVDGWDWRRASAIKSYGFYANAMSADVDRVVIEPWPGQSGLQVGGGLPKKDTDSNTTSLFTINDLWPYIEAATLLIRHGKHLIDAATQNLVTDPALIRSKGRIRSDASRPRKPERTVLVEANGVAVRLLSSDQNRLERARMLRLVASACAFVTVAFTGMRASEFDAIPRHDNLDCIAVSGTQRWLLTSYLTKGLQSPRRETWLIPPLVHDAVLVMQHLLTAAEHDDDVIYLPTGQSPLFDRRALSTFRGKEGKSATMRLERAMDAMGNAVDLLSGLGLTAPRASSATPDGRALRRNLTVVVSSRPGGPQAAMEQFKWQDPKTASGYFRVDPDGVALGQREVYNEVANFHTDLVVDALRDEWTVWEKQIKKGQHSSLPAGPDGRRKQDMFAALLNQLGHAPRTEEDHRRLRMLLRVHATSLHLTELGWCDWDESQAKCGGIGGPSIAKCQPLTCLNSSVPSTGLAAHQVKADRLMDLARDRNMPQMARERARAGAEATIQALAPHLERNAT